MCPFEIMHSLLFISFHCYLYRFHRQSPKNVVSNVERIPSGIWEYAFTSRDHKTFHKRSTNTKWNTRILFHHQSPKYVLSNVERILSGTREYASTAKVPRMSSQMLLEQILSGIRGYAFITKVPKSLLKCRKIPNGIQEYAFTAEVPKSTLVVRKRILF